MYATASNLPIDRTLQLIDSNGVAYSFSVNPTDPTVLGRLISFESQPDIEKIDTPGISDGGMVDAMLEHHSWSGTLVLDRRNANFDALWAQLEDAYHNNTGPQLKFTMHERTVNRDQNGGVAAFRYENSLVWMTTNGPWVLGTRPEIHCSFHATRRIPE